jgi:hypothetical protein
MGSAKVYCRLGDANEECCGEQEIFIRFIHDADEPVTLGIYIGDGSINLACLKGHRIAAVLKTQKEVGASKLTQTSTSHGCGNEPAEVGCRLDPLRHDSLNIRQGLLVG